MLCLDLGGSSFSENSSTCTHDLYTFWCNSVCLPNQGSYLACQNIKDLEVFSSMQEVKVDPDKPLEGVRLLALQVNPISLSWSPGH
uniref:Uncharacterized protein n=1 Tax=Rhinolophus ferrumequinum TaxID=59479 RepID=A0A671EYH1_RHIFE